MSLNRLKMSLLAHSMLAGALRFGSFTLKSGRQSPYFFNAAIINDGKGLDLVASAYAALIVDRGIKFDVLFGPAYKAISLAHLVAACLWRDHNVNVRAAYNRKEVKDHGEGGRLVGADVNGKRVLIIDDVMTAGTAINESIGILTEEGDAGTSVVGVVVMLDRQERGAGALSAVQEVSVKHNVPVWSIATFTDLLAFIDTSLPIIEGEYDGESVFDDAREYVPAMNEYRRQYGITVV